MSDLGVTITLREVYDKLCDIERVVMPLPAQVADHESRIRTVERWMWAIPASILVAAASIVTAMLARL